MNIDKLLEVMVDKRASDAFVTAGAPPSLKIHGKVQPLSSKKLGANEAKKVVTELMTTDQRGAFERHQECNFAIVREDLDAGLRKAVEEDKLALINWTGVT